MAASSWSVALTARPASPRWRPSPRPRSGTTATGMFSPAGSLAAARGWHAATLLTDGRVLVIGGWDGDDDVASAEVWDPATNAFSPAGSLTAVHDGHTATPLLDGRVLVVGGVGTTPGFLASAEVWDPATKAFEPGRLARAATRPSQRYAPARWPRPRGRWLGRPLGPHSASAEVWDPATEHVQPRQARSAAARRWPHRHAPARWPRPRHRWLGRQRAVLASAEVWDPTTETFSPAGSQAVARDEQHRHAPT